jgi:hypothetical protein
MKVLLADRGLECRAEKGSSASLPLRPFRSNLYLPASAFRANKTADARDMNYRQFVGHSQLIEGENLLPSGPEMDSAVD